MDPDCPECPESVRFWCITAGVCKDVEKVSVEGTAAINVASNSDTVGALCDAPSLTAGSGTASAAGRLSLSSLVNVAQQELQGNGSGAEPKAKAKGKNKGKKAQKEAPDSLSEKKDAARILHEKRTFSVYF